MESRFALKTFRIVTLVVCEHSSFPKRLYAYGGLPIELALILPEVLQEIALNFKILQKHSLMLSSVAFVQGFIHFRVMCVVHRTTSKEKPSHSTTSESVNSGNQFAFGKTRHIPHTEEHKCTCTENGICVIVNFGTIRNNHRSVNISVEFLHF